MDFGGPLKLPRNISINTYIHARPTYIYYPVTTNIRQITLFAQRRNQIKRNNTYGEEKHRTKVSDH